MKKVNYNKNEADKEIKKKLVENASEKFVITNDEKLKDKRTDILEKLILFYQNEYVPVLKKHNDIMIEWNEINIEMFSRGIITKNDVISSNELLKNKLEKLF